MTEAGRIGSDIRAGYDWQYRPVLAATIRNITHNISVPCIHPASKKFVRII